MNYVCIKYDKICSFIFSIHMAGTETATIWAGYLSGAVQAGRRAAIEILQNLRPSSVSAVDIQKNNTPFKK